MANYLYRDGVLPILIPNLQGEALKQILAQMDGFVFQGGSDLCPKTYNEPFLDESRWPGDEKRDQYELTIADYAFTHGKPMLGICRGAQLLNVYFSGTLYQDLPTEFPTTVSHRNVAEYDRHYHPVQFTPQLLLHQLYKHENNPHVCSLHHQGVKKLGKDLAIEAVSPDNLIEAFSHQAKDKFILGVQWHPEFSHMIKDKVISAEPVYESFLQAVRERNT